MRKLFVALVLVVALGVFAPAKVVAKPAYCLTALERCYDKCSDYYSWELSRSACYAGCLIGYAGCG